jgi:hypothetical protein
MKTRDLVRDFLNGATSGKSSNLLVEGNKLINYQTCIAYRIGSTVHLNAQKYSQTTSVHQNQIRREAITVVEYLTESEFNDAVRKL